MSINAGLILPAPSGNESWESPLWKNVTIQVKYPSGQNRVTNPPVINDIIVDAIGQIWQIFYASNIANTDKFLCNLKVLNFTTTEDIVPDMGGTNTGCICTPINGKLSPFWDASYVSTSVYRAARSYSVSSMETITDLSGIETKLDSILASAPSDADSFLEISNKMGSINDAVTAVTANVTAMKGSVPEAGNSLSKLYALISNGSGNSSGNMTAYTVQVTNWSAGSYILPNGWIATKANSETAIQIKHNLNKYPIGWTLINMESTPYITIAPSATRSVQINDLNTCTVTQCAVSNIFTVTLFF